MTVQHQPQGNRKSYDLIRFFRPAGSRTVVWVEDMGSGTILRLLRWGDEIYLPVFDGMELGIGVYNGSDTWRAYPTYIEARNIWDDGQAQPEDCDTDHMWELKPGMKQLFDKLMNPEANVGRPLIVTETGFGNTVGEAAFGTDAFRGQIRLYERIQVGGGLQSTRPVNKGAGGDEYLEGPIIQHYDFGNSPRGIPKGGVVPASRGRAGIGAGKEVRQDHYGTRVQYQRNAQPVVFFRVEYRQDLQPMLDLAWGRGVWNWYEPIPEVEFWWDLPWNWRRPTAPEVPVTKPHRPGGFR